MAVMEALAIVVAETVNSYFVAQPLQVRLDHIAHLGTVVIPVARRCVVRLVAVAVVGITRRLAFAVTGCRLVVHLIGAADPRSVRLECPILTEVVCAILVAVAALGTEVVNYNICHDLGTVQVKRVDQVQQVFLCAPVAIQLAVVRWVVTCTACSLAHRR